MAWKKGRDAEAAATSEHGGGKDTSNTKRHRSGSREGSVADMIHDEKTAQLIASFDEIQAGAVPGKVNAKLIHALRGVLTDGDLLRRERNHSLLLEIMRQEDFPALHELYLEMHRDNGRAFGEYKTFAAKWGEIDPEGAFAYLQAQKPQVLPSDDLKALMRGWGKTDPESALSWVEENPELSQRFGARMALMEGWLRSDPQAATNWLAKNRTTLDPGVYIECVRMGLIEQIHGASTDIQGAVDWLTGLPDDGINGMAASHAWNTSQWCLSELTYETAASVWGKLGNEPWMDFGQFQHFANVTSRTRTASEGMAGFFAELEKTWPQEKIVQQFERWAGTDPDRVANWLENAPASPVTDAARAGLEKAVASLHPGQGALIGGAAGGAIIGNQQEYEEPEE